MTVGDLKNAIRHLGDEVIVAVEYLDGSTNYDKLLLLPVANWTEEISSDDRKIVKLICIDGKEE
jgi:hypothetical protein